MKYSKELAEIQFRYEEMEKNMKEMRKKMKELADAAQQEKQVSEKITDEFQEHSDFEPARKTVKRPRTDHQDNTNIESVNIYSNLAEKDTEPEKQQEVEECDENPTLTRTEKVPPIVLRQKSKWIEVAKTLNRKHYNYVSARMTDEGVRIIAQTPEDYRNITKYMKKKEIEFHTYQLKSEKNLKIVIKGLLT